MKQAASCTPVPRSRTLEGVAQLLLYVLNRTIYGLWFNPDPSVHTLKSWTRVVLTFKRSEARISRAIYQEACRLASYRCRHLPVSAFYGDRPRSFIGFICRVQIHELRVLNPRRYAARLALRMLKAAAADPLAPRLIAASQADAACGVTVAPLARICTPDGGGPSQRAPPGQRAPPLARCIPGAPENPRLAAPPVRSQPVVQHREISVTSRPARLHPSWNGIIARP